MAKAKRKAPNGETGVPARKVEYGPLTDYLGYTLRRAQMSAVAEFLDAFREVDLRPTQFAVLTIIDSTPAPIGGRLTGAMGHNTLGISAEHHGTACKNQAFCRRSTK